MRIRQSASRTLVALLLCAGGALAAPQPLPEQFQAWLHKDVDAGHGWWIAPFEADDGEKTKQLANALLDGLWAQPAYRKNLETWLVAHHDGVVEDMLDSWYRHYHQAFSDSLEFVDADTGRLLYLLARFNVMYNLDRQACQGETSDSIEKFIRTERSAVRDKNLDKLANALPKALALEFERENQPRPGDRPVPAFMTAVVRASLAAVIKAAPAEDAERIRLQFSYNSGPRPSEQELCERNWVATHAILDSQIDRPKELVSAQLLRRSVMGASYSEAFMKADAPPGAVKPVTNGFKAGKAVVFMPRVVQAGRAAGLVQYKIDVDDAGKVISVVIESSKLAPEQVTSLDGSAVSAAALLLGVVDAYYRDGAFEPRQVDGKAVPFSVRASFNWK